MKIVQLSDLHLTLPDAELFGSAPLARLELAIDRILADHADAEFCLLTGDLGISYAYSTPVSELVLERLTVTIPLAFMAMAITFTAS